MKTYSIGEVAIQFGLTISTIRYYDKEKLIPKLQKNSSGKRIFTLDNIETFKMIECLKKAGMPIKDIKVFIQWCEAGDSTIPNRLEMFRELRQSVKEKLIDLEQTLDTLEYKCEYYSQAMIDGTEDYVRIKN